MEDIYKQSLEADKEGLWDKAHDLIQDLPTAEAAWIHAYLHKKEGDVSNARYWYARAGKPEYNGSLDSEWQELWNALTK
ncbi:hypothetical protein [Marinoscillum furvescens]|uniref:Tetratricopeptide repeat protein n=1 Tax=Marinoscillum furvescens DSM 4134 TaxID=1122208 RepID=A0A3D9L167_MARFU|nr:hypothetical protein [Marinoscillum furvescens]RED97492.1 hypothetical protein C7460_112102 [Marinoscillum furvescens DSM 4134]